jgi:MFS family permease
MNWITQMGLQCESAYKTSLLGSLFFVGVLLSSVILTLTSKYGRRINLIVGNIINCITELGLIFIPNLYVKYVLIVIFGMMYFKNIQAFVLATEYVQFKHKVYVSTAILAFNGITNPITGVYFKYISNDWHYIFYFYSALVVIITFLSLFVPESPRFLYEKEKFTEARFVINKM